MSIIQGFIGAVSNTVKYEIVPNYTSIDEGGTSSSQTVTYTITTGGVADGTTLYWSNAGTTIAADLGGSAQGSVAISGGTATFSLTATTDNTTEGSETIIIELYKDVGQTQLVATAATVTVGDTSLDPPVPGSGLFVASNNTSLKIGDTYWTINSYAVLGNVNAGTAIILRDASNNSYNTTVHDYANGTTFNVNKVTGMPQPILGWEWSLDAAFWWPIASSSEPELTNTPWNLGSTWTIEFWMRANGVSSSQQGLVCQDGWFGNLQGGNRDNAILVALVGGDLSVGLTNGFANNYYTEPAPGVWTHVAVVNTAGTIKTFYNGVEQTKRGYSESGSASYTNNYMPLYIGRLGGGYGGWFDGKITNVRITNTAVYSGNFASPILPTRINGNTKLLWTPTQYNLAVDSGDYATAIINNSVTYSTSYPIARYDFGTVPTSINEGSAGTFNFITVAVPDTTLYWETLNISTTNADLSALSGSFALVNSSGSFSVTPTADFTTEGSESFAVTVRTGASYTGTVVATCPPVTVNDTSITPTIHGSVTVGNESTKKYAVVASAGTYDIMSGPDALGNRYDVGSGFINSLAFAPDGIIETITPGWTVRFNNGDTRTITSINNFEGTYGLVLDSQFTYTAGDVFPLTLKSPDYVNRPWYLGNTWTLEWWQKANVSTASSGLLTVMCQRDSANAIDVYYLGGNLGLANTSVGISEPTPGVWTHVAIVSDAGTVTVYYNGVSQYSGMRNVTFTDSTRDLFIGRRQGDFQYFNGKLTNVRITNTKVYTGAFVPAVLPLKVSGTKLLWTPTNYSINTDASDIAATITSYNGMAYDSDYPNEFAYEAIQVGGGILTMTKSINGLSVQAAATNFDGSPAAGSYISIDGTIVASDILTGVGQDMTRGHTMVVVRKETNTIESINTYDTWETPTSIEAPLAAVTAGRIVIIVSYDATACTATMRNTLVNSYGATDTTSTWNSNRRSHLFIGTKR